MTDYDEMLKAYCREIGFKLARWHKYRHPVHGCWFFKAYDSLEANGGSVFECPAWALKGYFEGKEA